MLGPGRRGRSRRAVLVLGRTDLGEARSPAWGEGHLGLPSGSDRQPLESEFFLESIQLVQSWLGPGALVGQKGSN